MLDPSVSGFDAVQLRKEIEASFNLSELQTLCFDLKVPYENLAGVRLEDKARELITYSLRHGLLPELVLECRKLRPNNAWFKFVEHSLNRPAHYNPIDPSDFAYKLYFRQDIKIDLVPIPCKIRDEQYSDTVGELKQRIFDFYIERQRLEYDIHSKAWADSEYDESGSEITSSRLRFTRYQSLVSRRIKQTPLPKLLVLISGFTGSGKTSTLQTLARLFSSTFVDLRAYSTAVSLTTLISNSSEQENVVSQGISQRKAQLIFLDAFDKMWPGSTHREIIIHLRDIRQATHNYEVVFITARTQFFKSLSEEQLHGFTRAELHPLEPTSALALAANLGSRSSIQNAADKSDTVRDLIKTPLFVEMLINLAQNNCDITTIRDKTDLLSHVTERWLIRDTEDSILPNQVRLDLMKRLALHCLHTGGKPFRYSDIDMVIEDVIGTVTPENRERFNTDLRVCSFIRRYDPDLFEFQHALFYEYCVARTVFEDIKEGDFTAFEIQAFTSEIIDFLFTLACRMNQLDDLKIWIPLIWEKSINDRGRANILRLATKIGSLHLPLDGLDFIGQDFSSISFSKITAERVRFEECNFSGTSLENVHGIKWVFIACNLVDCSFQNVRFDISQFIDTTCTLFSRSSLSLLYCKINRCILKIDSLAYLLVHAGALYETCLQTIDTEDSRVHRKQ